MHSFFKWKIINLLKENQKNKINWQFQKFAAGVGKFALHYAFLREKGLIRHFVTPNFVQAVFGP